MRAGDPRVWLMKDSTIIALAFLTVCCVILVCLTVMVACGHNGPLISAFIGIAALFFGGNIWTLINSKRE